MLFVRCFRPCDVCSDLIRGDVCSILSPTMRSEISCSLSSSIAVADGRFVLFVSYLSSIHEKANCIAILWTGRPHSLGSCHF